MDEPWYAARCHFIARQPSEESPAVYEERIVLFRASSFKQAMQLAEEEAEVYASESAGREYLGYADVFHLFEEEIGHGTEVFSLMRRSALPPEEYLSTFFDTGQEHMSRGNEIGIAVVEHQGRYLVGTRGRDGPLPGYSEFPGGKCDLDEETPAGAAIRECFEETGLRVEIIEHLFEREFDYPHSRVDLRFFLCRPAAGSDVHNLRGTFRWVEAAELMQLQFPEANGPVIDKLLDRSRNAPADDLV